MYWMLPSVTVVAAAVAIHGWWRAHGLARVLAARASDAQLDPLTGFVPRAAAPHRMAIERERLLRIGGIACTMSARVSDPLLRRRLVGLLPVDALVLEGAGEIVTVVAAAPLPASADPGLAGIVWHQEMIA